MPFSREDITFAQFIVEKRLIRSGCRLEWWVGWVQGWGSQTGLAIAPLEDVQNTHHWSRRPQTSHQNSVGQAGNLKTFRHCCICASVASTSFSLCEGVVMVISSTAFNSDIWTVVGWYSSLIFLQLSVMTLCVLIHDDRLIHKVK